MIPDMVPKERQGTASAYMGMGTLIGQLGGLIVCGLLIERPHGLTVVMSVEAACLVVTMLYSVIVLRERSAEGNPAPKLGAVDSVTEPFRVKPKEHPDFFRLVGSRFVINLGFYTATAFLLYYCQDTLHAGKYTMDVVTKIFVIATFSGLLGNFPAGILGDRISKKHVIYASTAITSVGALVFLTTSQVSVAYLGAFIFGMGFGAFTAVDWAFATNLLPEHDEAKYMGIWNVASTVPQVIAPLLGGLAAYQFNHRIYQGFGYRATLSMVIIYLIVGTIMIRPIREKRDLEVRG
jgi:MFS family permease